MSGRKDTKPASAGSAQACKAYGGHGEKKIEDAPTTERRAGERWSLAASSPSTGCQADTRLPCPLVVPGQGVTPQVVRDGAQPSTIPQELERPLASSIAPIAATHSLGPSNLGPSESAKKLSAAAPSAAESATFNSMSAPLPPVAPKPTSWTAIVRAANPGEPAEPGMYLLVVNLV